MHKFDTFNIMSIPKYSKIENERRWLFPLTFLSKLDNLSYQKIEDLYLDCGRLRLRSLTHSQTGQRQFKLCKKYGPISNTAEPIVNIYLSFDEYTTLSILPGSKLIKSRYKLTIDRTQFNVDVFEGELSNLILCEIEAESEELLNAVMSPENAILEVTGNEIFSGGNLAKTDRSELEKILKPYLRP